MKYSGSQFTIQCDDETRVDCKFVRGGPPLEVIREFIVGLEITCGN